MATKIHLDRFEQAYQRLLKIDFEELQKLPDTPPAVNAIVNILLQLKERYDKVSTIKNELGDQTLSQAFSTLNSFLTTMERNLPPLNKNPTVLMPLETQIKTYFEQTYNWWPQVLSVLNSKLTAPEIRKTIEANEKLNEEIKKQKEISEAEAKLIEDLRINLESKINLLDTRYSSSIDAAELDKQKNLFQKAADQNKSAANRWLIFIILSLIFTSIVLYFIIKTFCFDLVCFSVDDLAKYKSICDTCPQNMLAYEVSKGALYRLLIISMLLFIIRFCVKNYNAQMHQYTINLHKMNSFDVALAFIIKSTPEGKDKIMTLAAQTIFSQHRTGYSGKDTPEEIKPTIIEKIVDKASDKI